MLGQRVRVYSTEAIALKRMDYGEADRILTLFTPGLGKLRAIAKGVRRSTSRMAGHLELFSHGQLMLARGRALDIVTQASTIEPLREVRDDLVRSSYAFHLAELVDVFLEDRDPHPDVFALLVNALHTLAESEVPADLVARHFEVRLLAMLGFGPELTTCLGCRSQIQAEANWYSVPCGGVLCPTCGGHEASAGPIEVRVLKMLRHLQRTSSPSALTVRVPGGVRDELERLVRRQMEFVLERKLKATDFVHRVAVPSVLAES
jgi:DNA repair protein RecO (recombination protein O)